MKKLIFWSCLLVFQAHAAFAQSGSEDLGEENKVKYECLDSKGAPYLIELANERAKKVSSMSEQNELKADFVDNARWSCEAAEGKFTQSGSTKTQ